MTPRRLVVTLAAMVALAGCSTLPAGADFSKRASAALEHPEQTHLGRQFTGVVRQDADSSGFRVIPVGAELPDTHAEYQRRRANA